jgi:hypothetical protein
MKNHIWRNNMEWKNIKEKMYKYNGLWKNIVIFDTAEDDWKIWFDFINENHKIITYSKNKIGFEAIKYIWENPAKNVLPLFQVNVNNILFYIKTEKQNIMENQFDPRIIEGEKEHKIIINFMKELSKALGKETVLLEEKFKDTNEIKNYIKVNGETIEYKVE